MKYAAESIGKPRLRLTLAYAGILMLVLAVFSVIVYVLLSLIVRQDIEPFRDDPGIVAAAQNMLRRDGLLLVVANAGALVVVIVASAILARVTLRPLEQAITLQREFTNTASHDLRTPLAVIRTETSAALHKDAPIEAADFKERLTIVDEQAQRMERMIDQLLTLSHVDAARALNLEPVDLLAVSSAVIRDLRPLAQTRSIELRLARAESAIVMGDELKLSQLVTNLTENAVHHGLKRNQVDLAVWQERDQACVSVSDRGPGIAQADLESIFLRDRRLHAPSLNGHSGHGLGLPLCRWIARAHGGDVFISSRPGVGSTFTVRLPAIV
jgi:signal transduction histidine kinase